MTPNELALCINKQVFLTRIEANLKNRVIDVNEVLKDTLLIARSVCETDPSYLQLIPYVVIVKVDSKGDRQVLCYDRIKGGGEARLYGLTSVGFGGHINTNPEPDVPMNVHLGTDCHRELSEELIWVNNPDGFDVDQLCEDFKKSFIILADHDVLNSVHLGLLKFIEITGEHEFVSGEPDKVGRVRWTGINDLAAMAEAGLLETWSEVASYVLRTELILGAATAQINAAKALQHN